MDRAGSPIRYDKELLKSMNARSIGAGLCSKRQAAGICGIVSGDGVWCMVYGGCSMIDVW